MCTTDLSNAVGRLARSMCARGRKRSRDTLSSPYSDNETQLFRDNSLDPQGPMTGWKEARHASKRKRAFATAPAQLDQCSLITHPNGVDLKPHAIEIAPTKAIDNPLLFVDCAAALGATACSHQLPNKLSCKREQHGHDSQPDHNESAATTCITQQQQMSRGVHPEPVHVASSAAIARTPADADSSSSEGSCSTTPSAKRLRTEASALYSPSRLSHESCPSEEEDATSSLDPCTPECNKVATGKKMLLRASNNEMNWDALFYATPTSQQNSSSADSSKCSRRRRRSRRRHESLYFAALQQVAKISGLEDFLDRRAAAAEEAAFAAALAAMQWQGVEIPGLSLNHCPTVASFSADDYASMVGQQDNPIVVHQLFSNNDTEYMGRSSVLVDNSGNSSAWQPSFLPRSHLARQIYAKVCAQARNEQVVLHSSSQTSLDASVFNPNEGIEAEQAAGQYELSHHTSQWASFPPEFDDMDAFMSNEEHAEDYSGIRGGAVYSAAADDGSWIAGEADHGDLTDDEYEAMLRDAEDLMLLRGDDELEGTIEDHVSARDAVQEEDAADYGLGEDYDSEMEWHQFK